MFRTSLALLSVVVVFANVLHVYSACVDYEAHPNGDCSAFVRCVGNKGIIMYCGQGTKFNPKLKVCDWPQNVNCGSKPTTPPPTTKPPTTKPPTTKPPTTKPTTQPPTTQPTTPTKPHNPYPPCRNQPGIVGKYPDLKSNCQIYYECKNGVVSLKACPLGTRYDIWTQYCQLQSLATPCKFVM
ncbi:hypothetical protein Ahia01_000538300 [Argonauta hians]